MYIHIYALYKYSLPWFQTLPQLSLEHLPTLVHHLNSYFSAIAEVVQFLSAKVLLWWFKVEIFLRLVDLIESSAQIYFRQIYFASIFTAFVWNSMNNHFEGPESKVSKTGYQIQLTVLSVPL